MPSRWAWSPRSGRNLAPATSWEVARFHRNMVEEGARATSPAVPCRAEMWMCQSTWVSTARSLGSAHDDDDATAVDRLASPDLWSVAVTSVETLKPKCWVEGAIMDMFMMQAAWTGRERKWGMYVDIQTGRELCQAQMAGDRVALCRRRFEAVMTSTGEGCRGTYVVIMHGNNHYWSLYVNVPLGVVIQYGRDHAASGPVAKQVRWQSAATAPLKNMWKNLLLVSLSGPTRQQPKHFWVVEWKQASAIPPTIPPTTADV